jgi:hypothetical protein
MKSYKTAIVVVLLLPVPQIYGQNTIPSTPLERAVITHEPSNMVQIEAHEARPLRQALVGLRSEYGWVVDYEDPIYDKAKDVVDDTSPKWREQNPGRPGVTRPAGERFVFTSQEPNSLELESGQAQSQLLKQMVRSYSSSKNPGTFTVVDDGMKRFAIVGILPSGHPGLFDNSINLNRENRTAEDTLIATFQAVGQQIGKKIELGFAPITLLAGARLDAGGNQVRARDIVAQALDSTHANLVYEALSDADQDEYMVNILPAIRSYYSVSGERIDSLLKKR